MKKLLLILGLALLLAATAVSAQEWAVRVSQIYQCNGGTPMSIWQTAFGGMNYDCSDVRGRLDPYDTKLYILTENYAKENNLLASTNKIIQCGQNLLTQSTPAEWGFITVSTEPCLVGTTTGQNIRGYSFKQQLPGTKEVFLCTNNQRPFIVYSISTDPNCRSSNNDRKGYTKVASLGFWPQSTDFKLPPPPSPEVCCMLTNDRGDRKANVMQKTQCEEEAKKMGAKYTTSTKEECDKEVCCTYEGNYKWTQNGKCFERKGIVLVDKTRETCREPESVCGNGLVERGEDCEPPATATCDARCRTIAPPPAVCPVTRAENDALLATLSQLEKERDSYAKKQVCCGTERVKAGRETRRDVKVMTLGECNNMAKEQPIFGLFNPERCEAKVCCALKDKTIMSVFRECIMNNGAEVEGAKCAAPPAPQCGNQIKETGEACEKDLDCGENLRCTACKCAKVDVTVTPPIPTAPTETAHTYQVWLPERKFITLLKEGGGGYAGMPYESDMGYLMRTVPAGILPESVAEIAVCHHEFGVSPSSLSETEIKFGAPCDAETRASDHYPTVTKEMIGYAFKNPKTNTRLAYLCKKNWGLGILHNFRVSFNQDCNERQTDWAGYTNQGTLGYWLTTETVPK